MKGDAVIADIGGDLNIQSLQDTDNYDYEKLSASVDGSAGFGGGSLNVSLSATEMESNWSSVTDQAGIYAGSGGYDIRVEGNTDLKGAVIASEANDALKNVLDTGTISFSDIENKSDFDVSHVSVSVGTGSGAPPVSYNNSGSDSSTTHSAVEQGIIIVRDQENQKQDIDDLSRDTENANNVLGQSFDKNKELENIEVVGLVKDISQQAKDVVGSLKEMGLIDAETGMGSDLMKGLDAVTSIITGALTGDITGGLAGATAPYLAEEIKKATGTNDTANAIAHAVLGAIVAELQGGSALAGATGAAVGEVAAKMIADKLYPGRDISTLSEQEKAIVLQLANVAAGMAGAISGGSVTDAGTAASASDNAVQNNAMNLYIEAAKALLKPGSIGAPVTINAEQVLMAQAGLTALQAKEFLDSLSESERHLMTMAMADPAGNEFFAQAVGETFNRYSEKYLTTIGVNPDDIPKLEGFPIPEENKGWSTGTPIQDQNKDDGKLSTPISEQNKDSGILAGPEIETGNWQDNIVTSDNRLPIPEPITANNGLQIESNPKHTINIRPNAGIEPKNSLDIFEQSIATSDPKVRLAIDSEGNVHRFSNSSKDGTGAYHWSGSTGDKSNPLGHDELRKFNDVLKQLRGK